MARYKPVDRNPRLLPVVLSEQIQPGTFEFALDLTQWRLYCLVHNIEKLAGCDLKK